VNRGGLSLLDIATGTMTPLNIAAEMPRWSPSGDWIAYGSNGTLHLVHPDGTGIVDVAGGRQYDPRADWSPDAGWLIARSSTRLELVDMKSGAILPIAWSRSLIRPVFRRQ
jgi:Tol biopolymer transport system component